MNYQIDDEVFNFSSFDHTWEINVQEDEPAAKLEVLREVDWSLCESMHVAMAGGDFFLFWGEEHPERAGGFNANFPPGSYTDEEMALKEWRELNARLPSKHNMRKISRKEAFTLVALAWLPAEFHTDAGLC